ncbi:GntR family transcriptional regulator [Caulobacter sp. X]|jgi:DNA-binding Lrp family transcriptional regulator|uniref:GntR family transcriptional regulator n=1 Tax=Caulobacter sp. X TaxID=2048901 RepID=UPI000C14D3F5|nr:GntR family transcriptional regulator [Caulobacter sp. X]PIB96930.1 hypothetical protein CSW60_20825 [Caulobacter sp. X]
MAHAGIQTPAPSRGRIRRVGEGGAWKIDDRSPSRLDASSLPEKTPCPPKWESVVGRDRDPFDRTIAFVRERVATLPPLQGAMIPINALAKQLNLSQTPVREALATLAGEGLILRADAGYAGATHDPRSLAGQYDLAELLANRAVQLIGGRPVDLTDAASFEAGVAVIVTAADQAALGEAYRRVAAQLTPFTNAAATVAGDAEVSLEGLVAAFSGQDARKRSQAVRGPLQRRRRFADRILVVALGLRSVRQI